MTEFDNLLPEFALLSGEKLSIFTSTRGAVFRIIVNDGDIDPFD